LRQASEWVQRLNESFGDESVIEAWSLWCANDPLNFQAFERMEELCEGYRPLPPAAAADPSMLTASYGLRKIVPQPRAWIGAATACVFISVSLVIWWVMHSTGVKEFSTSVGEQRREILAVGSASTS
jgi:ferric-dicitrate binding protein FerR (iron transport regulator)